MSSDDAVPAERARPPVRRPAPAQRPILDAIGYLGRITDLDPSRRERELRDRRRRPVDRTAVVGGCDGPEFRP